MKKILVITSILILSISLSGKSKMTFKDTTFDIGEVESGKVVNAKFEFENTGDSLLVIKSINTSCGCTVTRLSKKEYKPGEKGAIPVKFYTTGLRGNVQKTITISTNDTENVYQTLKLVGKVTLKDFAQAEIDPKIINFKTVNLGEKYSEILTIRNSGTTNLLIIEVTHSPEIYPEFGQKVILPGEAVEVPIVFKPMEKGAFSTFLKIRTNSYRHYFKIVKVTATVEQKIVEEPEE